MRKRRFSAGVFFASIGPGMITAALVFGPSKITITSKMGAFYGSDLLWVVAIAVFFMALFTTMSARIGMAGDRSLLQLIRQKWGRLAALAAGLGVFLVCTSFQAGNAIGVGIALAELTNTSPSLWVIVFTVIAISMLFLKSFYKALERIMILLIFLMLASFILTLFVSKPSAESLINGFRFELPTQSLPLVIAFMASCVSIVGALYQSYLVQERRRIRPEIKAFRNDSLPGIFILGLMSAIVMLCAATVLFPKQIGISSATDMSRALQPLFGQNASAVFLIGLFGAGFSSLVGNATVGGSLLGDALSFGSQLSDFRVKLLIAAVMVVGAIVALVYGGMPLELIVFAQSITIFIVPFLGIALFIIANDKSIMGKYQNSTLSACFLVLGLLMIIGLAILNFKELFLK